jgi:hypothetical protein
VGRSSRWRVARFLAIPLVAFLFVGSLVVGSRFSSSGAPAAHATSARLVTLQDFQALIFVWASGTPAVQQVAQQTCAQMHLTTQQCASVSAAVRGGWLDLAGSDPSALGRVGVGPNPQGRTQALDALAVQLASITGGRTAALLAATHVAYGQITSPGWAQASTLASGRALPAGTVLVWATSYQQSSLPGGLSTKKSPYAALPDAYVKYANWGNISSIPSIYQPYYAPSGATTHWTVSIATADGSRSVSNVLVTDVGPWNEDDNWWDANGTSASLPASCPVSTSLVAPDATSNALVDGICPNGQNLRRIYYYLLYQHYGLPFFQSGGYAPSGTFADGSAWPAALAQGCSEAAAASQNSDGITCYGGPAGYNGNSGGWLRTGAYDTPVLNQSSVDVSPAVDRALGWTYPSSGLVQLYVGALP